MARLLQVKHFTSLRSKVPGYVPWIKLGKRKRNGDLAFGFGQTRVLRYLIDCRAARRGEDEWFRDQGVGLEDGISRSLFYSKYARIFALEGLCELVLEGKVVTGIGYLSCDGDDGMNV